MEENLKLGKCGGCGNDSFKIYKNDSKYDRVLFECTQCHDTTELTITQPKLSINWCEKSEGILTFNM